jgi:diacylglycerol kinase family enzyme
MGRRTLLIVNRTSGTGCGPAMAGRLLRELTLACPGSELELELVDDHPSTRQVARRFFAASSRPAAVIAGGGGGTLRAAVEGVCDAANGTLPPGDALVLGALRMGSGNVVARRLGVAQDPIEGIRRLAASLDANRTARCAVIRCRFGTASGEDLRHAVTMCGLGQFGRTSGDLARWHARLPEPRRAIASVVGIERLNNFEYAASAAGRLLASTIAPGTAEEVQVTLGERSERFRLLAGAVMNFPIGAIPFDPRVTMGEAAAGVLLLPRGGRLRTWRLNAGDRLRVEFLDRESVEFFLDEDPERAHRELTIDVPGTLSFVLGTREGAA